MSKIHDGGPAFPQFEVVAGERDGHGDIIEAYTVAKGGMSLRDWFAGKALSGLLASSDITVPSNVGTFEEIAAHFAGVSYAYADAMLAARKTEHAP